MVLLEIGVLAVSLFALAKSAGIVAENAAKLSRFFGISQMAVGFLLLSISTSLPELSVSILSSTLGEGAIAAGNVFGSNIANILLVLGAGAFLYGIKIGKTELKDVALVLSLTTIISAYIIFNSYIRLQALGFGEGILLLMIFGWYVVSVLRRQKVEVNGDGKITKKEALRAFLFFSAAILVVFISSGFVVEVAVRISKALGIAESFIGATAIALGTSLPELAIDLQAIRKRHYGLALGDAIGSNMVNLTLVLGIAAVINPITIMLPVFIAALLFAIAANAFLFYSAAVERKLWRVGGALFLAAYVLFVLTIFYLQLSELS